MIVLKLIFKNLRRNKKNNFIFSLSILIVILFILSFNSYAELNNIDLDRSLVYNSDINIYGANYSSFESFNTDYSGDNNNNNNIHYINLDKSVLTQLSSNNLQELKNLSNMAKISPLYSFPDKTNISSNFKILAFNSNDYGAIGINITEGALFNNSNEIILSDSLKNKFHLKIGDSIKIANSSYYCTGFFSSNYILNDYGLIYSILFSFRIFINFINYFIFGNYFFNFINKDFMHFNEFFICL